MQDFWFYLRLGLNHVLDLSAYDHILFLAALAVPFTFKSWRQVLLLATVFTISHCVSLTFAVYDVVSLDVALIEFLIALTIFLTAVFNLNYIQAATEERTLQPILLATAFFGLIHGFGFSNYFKMLVEGSTNKGGPLLGFATGIEISQLLIVFAILVLALFFQNVLRVKQDIFIVVASILIALVTIPMLVTTFPW